MKEFTPSRAGELSPGRGTRTQTEAAARLDRIHFSAAALALGLTAFLAIEPTQNWLLLLLCGLAGLAADAVVRTHPRARFHRLDDTALFLFVPVLFTLGAGLFLEEVASGHWTLLAGTLSAIPYWAILRAEYDCVDRRASGYQAARLILNIATYVIAFLLFATVYDFDLAVATAAFAAGVISILLGIEVLREEAMDTVRTVTYAVAVGVLMAQAAWATDFLPLNGGAAAVFLLLAFYLTTGLMHNYLGSRLDLRTGAEFAAVALAGLVIVILAQAIL